MSEQKPGFLWQGPPPEDIQADLDRAGLPVSSRQLPPLPEGDIFATPSREERAEAMQTGFLRGAAEGASVVAPMWAGAKTGFMLGGPKGALVGGTAGFIGGMYAADVIGQMFPEVSREDLTFAYEAPRTLAGGLAFSPLAFTFRSAPSGANKLRETIGAIGDFARKYPGRYLATEGIVSFYAGLAGGAAAQSFPDQPLIRPVAEIAVAGLVPSRLVYQAGESLKNAFSKAFTAQTLDNIPDNVKNYVGTSLVQLWQDAGEDPKAFVRLIEESLESLPLSPDGVRPSPTVAQLTGSKTATAFEKLLAQNHAKFSVDTAQAGEDALRAYKEIALALEKTGDPTMIRAAAEFRRQSLENQFQTAFNTAQAAAMERAAKLGVSGSDARAAIGMFLRDEIEKFTRVARSTESDLWNTAIRSAFTEAGGQLRPISVRPSNFVNALYEITSSPYSSISRTALNKELKGMGADLKRIGLDKSKFEVMEGLPVSAEYLDTRTLSPEAMAALDIQDASAIDLVRFRSALLEKAREAGSTGRADAAQRYSRLAASILDDLEALPGESYNEARAFSRAFKDVYKRTFVGEVDRVTARGLDVYSPENLVQRAFSGGADTTLMRMREMGEAANFIDPTGQAAASVFEAQQKVLRAFAAETVRDGMINPASFESFRTKHRDALRYLGMEDEFADIASAQRALLDIGSPDTQMARYIRDEKVFASLLKTDDAYFAISNALHSQQPVKGFQYLAELARSHPTNPEAAIDGLRSNLFQYAYQTADKGPGGFNAQAFHDVFFKPFSPNTPSLANMMRTNNVIGGEELSRLRQLTQKMLNIEKSLAARGSSIDPSDVFSPQDAIENLAYAMIGAKFAKAIGPGGPGSLSFASRAINMTQDFLKGMPARNQLMLMQEAAKDGKLMADLMRRGMNTVEEQQALQRTMLRHFYPSNIFPTAVARYMQGVEDEDIERMKQRQMEALGASQLLRQLPPAPSTRGVPNLQLQTPPQGPAGEALEQMPPGQEPMPGPTSSSREMFQRLFPNEMS